MIRRASVPSARPRYVSSRKAQQPNAALKLHPHPRPGTRGATRRAVLHIASFYHNGALPVELVVKFAYVVGNSSN